MADQIGTTDSELNRDRMGQRVRGCLSELDDIVSDLLGGDEVTGQLDQIIEAGTHNRGAGHANADTHNRGTGRTDAELRPYAEAIADYDKALKFDPGNDKAIAAKADAVKAIVDKFIESGKKHFTKKEYGQAVTDFTEAIKLDPENTEAYYSRGRSYAALEERR
jgi:tetratricopeptide (TPR) repeat protein